MSGASSSISVTVRVRPFSIREAAQITRPDDSPSYFGDGSLASAPKTLAGKGIRRVVKVMDERMLVFDPPEDNPMARYQKTILPQGKRVKDMRFGFDRVFDETCSQEDVYEATSKSLLDSVLDGYNSTVFAYGATGCGKTHTISGTPQQPGIVFLTCAELFERIDLLRDEKEIDLTLSYLEIYNETIRDLLVPGGSKQGLSLREDTNQNISVAGLSAHQPKCVEEVMDMIVMGNANRTMSPTEANATSSRSHAVLQINVTQKPKTAGIQESHFAATLSIIDLAGSERASVTKNRGERLLEGANINRSLLALGNCINALCDPTRKNHVPYRDSKLTRLLKFSLGGNCKTVMIVCVSPSSQHYDETHNTLKYANRAKNIKTKVSRNMINVNRHVSQYVKAIYDLRQEVEDLKKRLGNSTKEAMEKINKQSTSKEAAMREGLKRLKLSFEQSKDVRTERVNQLKSLRMLERRMSLIQAWMAAFDEVFANRQHEEPPVILFKMRSEASKVFQELEENRVYIQQKLAGPSWEKIIDTALQNSLKNLNAIEGVLESDIAALTCEANLLRMTAERDVLHAIAQADVDFSSCVHNLSKAHFQTVITINNILNSNISEAEALEEARRSLFEVQQCASDAVSHIVKPGGELVSTDIYQPSPKKKIYIAASPVRPNPGLLGAASPLRGSPRTHKVKSPKKAVKFTKKSPSKKRVRFQDDVEDVFPTEDPKKSRIVDGAPSKSYSLSPPPPSPPPAASPTERETSPPIEAPSGIDARPIRPRNSRFEIGALSKNRDSPPVASAQVPLPNTSDSPLRSVDLVDSVINRLKQSDDGEMGSSDEAANWLKGAVVLPKAAMRKSSAGNSRPVTKKRSPSSSSQTSPDQPLWKIGTAKRMSKGGQENTGSVSSVLSPKGGAGIKGAARRMTVGGSGSMRIGSATVQNLREHAIRESTGGLSKGWR